jgi:hypothetical protein
MNSVEARTRIEGLLDKRDELLNDVAAITANAIASRSQKGDVSTSDIDNLLKDFTADEKYIIMVKVVSILAANSNLKVGKYDKKPKNDDINNIFASRGYR